jgi:hypothetical protein
MPFFPVFCFHHALIYHKAFTSALPSDGKVLCSHIGLLTSIRPDWLISKEMSFLAFLSYKFSMIST